MNAISSETGQPVKSELSPHRLFLAMSPFILGGLYFWSLWSFWTTIRPTANVSEANWKILPWLAFIVGGLVISLVYNSSIRASIRGAYQMIDGAFFVNPAPVPKPLMILGVSGRLKLTQFRGHLILKGEGATLPATWPGVSPATTYVRAPTGLHATLPIQRLRAAGRCSLHKLITQATTELTTELAPPV